MKLIYGDSQTSRELYCSPSFISLAPITIDFLSTGHILCSSTSSITALVLLAWILCSYITTAVALALGVSPKFHGRTDLDEKASIWKLCSGFVPAHRPRFAVLGQLTSFR